MNGSTPTTGEQRLTRGRQIAEQSPIVISKARNEQVTRDKNRYDALRVKEPQETVGVQLGVASTHNLRRWLSTCGFLLRRYSTSDTESDSSGYPISSSALSGSEDESAHPQNRMSHHYRNSSDNHRQTTEPTDDHPSKPIEQIDDEHILVTITDYGWTTYIRHERANEYTVRYENAAGMVSGTLSLDRREAQRLLTEQSVEAVWSALRPRAA